MAFARLEHQGVVAYVQGSRVLKIPVEADCRERLIQLLESAGGDKEHKLVEEFWRERITAMTDADELKAAWATELFERLNKVWDELTTAPPAEDVFAAYGI